MTHNYPQILGYGNVLLGIPFFHMGFLLKAHKEKLKEPHWIIIAALAYIIIAIFFPVRLEFVRNILVQGNYLLNFVFTLAACFILWRISQMWEHDNIIGKGLIYLGRNSLVVFAFHRPVLNWIIEPILRSIYPEVAYHVFLIVSLISIIILYLFLNYLLKKYFPILVAIRTK